MGTYTLYTWMIWEQALDINENRPHPTTSVSPQEEWAILKALLVRYWGSFEV